MRKQNKKATIILKTYMVICLVGILTLLGGCQSFKMPSMPSMPSMPEMPEMPEMPDFSKFSLPFSKTAAPQDITSLHATPDTSSLKCTIMDGSAKSSQGWYDIHPASFNLPENVTRNIIIDYKNSVEKTTLTARHDTESQKLVLCPLHSSKNSAACRTIYALEGDFESGIQRTLDIPDALRGGHIACSLPRGNISKVSPPANENP